ncbi:MAG: sulfatase-like hydrolase/transferase [Rhodospirillaceae bacterium]|jgi:arylsulfatase A-like enzyme|nr:sulfatase-like hydrolase/transferase [Rhodospirillaceae bacterium]MBT4486803.1 sulfatase-like hydrolase/transferase [Rhodospirillaceae bacterium]MBT5194474.1 sulfatase-like hydrolase/transferase [Rhodospirillaceae bacterium]MBT5895218.1 sulfatase-like hydrolase/transferase [Rhodospirillaceae bacterium]MBT6431027.1 sulfatase-like hydrolase/transferase [Rhodospirillaceae bacterium]
MAKQPNFILFMTDQQRWDHLGCNGNEILKTPNIDAIAARGVGFDRFNVASAVCMPNRSTLVTGRMPSLHGVRYNGVPLRRDAVTFVDLLRAGGYSTGLVGKSHLQNFTNMPAAVSAVSGDGDAPPADLSEARRGTISGSEYEDEKMPADGRRGYLDLATPFYGFDHVELCTLHGDRVRGHYDLWLKERHSDADGLRGPDNAIPEPDYSAPQSWHTAIPEEHYTSSYVADRSEAFLEAQDPHKPFFLQCSFPDPHHPYNPPGKYFRMYDPDAMELPASYHNSSPQPTTAYIQARTAAGDVDRNTIQPFAASERETKEIIALTYGMIAMIDDCVGRVMAKLEALGLEQDTVILFTSDHGDFMGDHGIMLKGPLHYQGLVKVPFIWSDPGDGLNGVRQDGLAGTIDIARTVLARAGLAPFNGMQGHDLGPLMRGEVDGLRDGMMVEQDAQRPNFHFDGPIKARTYLTQRWRLSRYMGSEFGELYDLQNDPNEMQNLWDEPGHAEIKGKLLGDMVLAMIENQESSPHPTDFA